jgi:hypothetical protein
LENQGPRKATDVLLELESKVDTALSIIRAQDLNLKLLSNKLNSLIEKLDKQPELKSFVNRAPQFTVEAVQTSAAPPQFAQPAPVEKQVPIFSDYKLPVEEAPLGFRRTSRPETYSGDVYLPKPVEPKPAEPPAVKFPTQVVKAPPGRTAGPAEVMVPPQATKQPPPQSSTPPTQPQAQANKGSVPVEQRIVDKNGKSVFLADVEIVDLTTGDQIFKTRTNGAGKWAAALAVGSYRVTISKRESLTKQKVEVVQDVQVTGMESPLMLQMMIIK